VSASWFRFRLEVLRATTARSGLNTPRKGVGQPAGATSADKWDVSDGERVAAQAVSASISCRFLVRANAFTRTIGPKDQLRCDGRLYDVAGVKEPSAWRGQPLPPRRYLEISASARTDLAA
jgi:hypothetical protein